MPRLCNHSKGGYQACGNVAKAAGTQCAVMAVFSDISERSSPPNIDNLGNDEGGERLG